MIRFSPKDSSILARVVQYEQLPKQGRKALLRQSSAKAQEVGEIILGAPPDKFDEDVREAAKAYQEWAQRNRQAAAPPMQRR
jgi:hypothetical protein